MIDRQNTTDVMAKTTPVFLYQASAIHLQMLWRNYSKFYSKPKISILVGYMRGFGLYDPGIGSMCAGSSHQKSGSVTESIRTCVIDQPDDTKLIVVGNGHLVAAKKNGQNVSAKQRIYQCTCVAI